MPWLPMYTDEVDVRELLNLLNRHPDIAFIVSNGPGRWIARSEMPSVSDSRYCIWHTPSGPLPLIGPQGCPQNVVNSPWEGWQELRPGADIRVPFFGAGHPGVIWWNVKTRSKRSGGIG